MGKPEYYLFSGGRQLGKTKMLQEDFEKKIEEARQTLFNHNKAITRFQIIFPKIF